MEKWNSTDTEGGQSAQTNPYHHALVPSPPPPRTSCPPNAQLVPADSCGSRDPNLANPRLHLNRTCIYERHLPADAYITAHVSRLQHGFYSSPAVSEQDFDHVDFLAVDFVFHAPHTLTHRFKAATIRMSVQNAHQANVRATSSANPASLTPTAAAGAASSSKPTFYNEQSHAHPQFLRHAPHLIYGAVSPETLQWTFSLAGSLGISEAPLSASLVPSGSMYGKFDRYEMLRIQGSSRALRSPLGPAFDVDNGEIVWSLEENTLQRSGLPREFTFVMLIQKPHAHSNILLSVEIDPMIQAWFGSFPHWWLSLTKYQSRPRRPVNFRREVGQRFEPITSAKGFNFARLESTFDDYVNMPGSTLSASRAVAISPDGVPFIGDIVSHTPARAGPTASGPPSGAPNMPSVSLRTGPSWPHASHRHSLTVPATTTAIGSHGGRPPASGPAAVAGIGLEPGNTLNVRVYLDSSTPSHAYSTGVARSPQPTPPAVAAETGHKNSSGRPSSVRQPAPRDRMVNHDHRYGYEQYQRQNRNLKHTTRADDRGEDLRGVLDEVGVNPSIGQGGHDKDQDEDEDGDEVIAAILTTTSGGGRFLYGSGW